MALTFRPFLQCCLLPQLRVRIPQQQSGPNPYTVKNEIHNIIYINKTELSKYQIHRQISVVNTIVQWYNRKKLHITDVLGFFFTSLPSSSTSLFDANGSLCSWSKYFSRLKNVSKKMGVIRHLFISCSDITLRFFGIIISNIWKVRNIVKLIIWTIFERCSYST